MKSLFFTILSIICACLNTTAQTTVSSSNEISKIKKTTTSKYIGKLDGVYYFLREGEYTVGNGSTTYIDYYDETGALKKTVELDFFKKESVDKYFVWDIILLKEKLFVFYTKLHFLSQSDMSRSVALLQVDAKTGAHSGKLLDIASLNSYKNLSPLEMVFELGNMGDYLFAISPNKEHFAFALPFSEQKNGKLSVTICNSNDLTTTKKEFEVTKKQDASLEVNQFLVLDNQSLLFNITVSNDKETNPLLKKEHRLISFKEGSAKEIKPNWGNYLPTEILLKNDNGKCIGTAMVSSIEKTYRKVQESQNLSDENNIITQGIAAFEIDSKTHEIAFFSTNLFDKPFLMNTNWHSVLKNSIEEGIPYLSLMDIHRASDGGIYSVSEIHRFYVSKDNTQVNNLGAAVGRYTYGNIYLSYFSADGKTKWNKGIVKEQSKSESYTNYGGSVDLTRNNFIKEYPCEECSQFSVSSFLSNDKLYLVYNDHSANSQVYFENTKIKMYEGGKNVITRLMQVNPEGKVMQLNAIYDDKEKRFSTIPLPTYFDLTTKADAPVFYAGDKKKWRFIQVKTQ